MHVSPPDLCSLPLLWGSCGGLVVTQGRRGLWDKGWESVEVLGPPRPNHRWGHQEEMRGGSIRSPHLRPAPRKQGVEPRHTWSLSPTSTIVISPTISIQLVPQGLCELTPLRNHTWERQT